MSTVRWMLVLTLLVLIGGAITSPPARVASLQSSAQLSVPDHSTEESEGPFDLEVTASNVENLGAFAFVVSYDADILELVAIERGPFLASTGREVICDDPDLTAGGARWSCVTLGATPPGPSGAGALAILQFDPKGTGTSPIHLSRVRMTHPDASEIVLTTQDGAVEVSGSEGRQWWWVVVAIVVVVTVIGLAGAIVLKRKRSAAHV